MSSSRRRTSASTSRAHAAVQLLAPRPPAGPWGRPPLHVRRVTASNVSDEVAMLRRLIYYFPIVAVDTHYPGIVQYNPVNERQDDGGDELYKVVKPNVDQLHLLQLGITICDRVGRLPVGPDPYGGGGLVEYTWEVSFCDFDVTRDRHSTHSVAFLETQGLDFEFARRCGVTADAFANELHRSGILTRPLTWITYGGMYDLAYMLKTVTRGQPLPESKADFLRALRVHLGCRIYDVKYVASLLGVNGSLKSVARSLGVPPWLIPANHSAGLNSVVTCHAFVLLWMRLFPYDDMGSLPLALQLDGFHRAAVFRNNTNLVRARLEHYRTWW